MKRGVNIMRASSMNLRSSLLSVAVVAFAYLALWGVRSENSQTPYGSVLGTHYRVAFVYDVLNEHQHDWKTTSPTIEELVDVFKDTRPGSEELLTDLWLQPLRVHCVQGDKGAKVKRVWSIGANATDESGWGDDIMVADRWSRADADFAVRAGAYWADSRVAAVILLGVVASAAAIGVMLSVYSPSPSCENLRIALEIAICVSLFAAGCAWDFSLWSGQFISIQSKGFNLAWFAMSLGLFRVVGISRRIALVSY